jgi:hypothetical protein
VLLHELRLKLPFVLLAALKLGVLVLDPTPLEQQKEGDVNVDNLSRTHSLRNLARNGTNPPKKSNKEFKHLNREFTWIMIRTSRVHRIGRRKSHDLRQQCQSENQECPRDHFN